MFNRNLLIALTFACASCAVTPQQATLDPELQLPVTNIGNDTTVVMRVVDERPDSSLGHRGAAYKGAEITTDQDVGAVIYKSIAEGLESNGFNPVPFTEDIPRMLRVDIRLLEYSTSMCFWTGGIHTKAALKITADNDGKIYENFYRANNEKRVFFVPFADENEKLINAVAIDVLQQLFQDQELFCSWPIRLTIWSSQAKDWNSPDN